MKDWEKDKLIELFNQFILDWASEAYPHLIDTDDNAGQRFRKQIVASLQSAHRDGLLRGAEIVEQAEPDPHYWKSEVVDLIKKEAGE